MSDLHEDRRYAEDDAVIRTLLTAAARLAARRYGGAVRPGAVRSGFSYLVDYARVLQHENAPEPEPFRTPKETVLPAIRWAVFKRDGYACIRCDSEIDLTVDHIIPEAEGGQATLENLQTLCRPCNARKGTNP